MKKVFFRIWAVVYLLVAGLVLKAQAPVTAIINLPPPYSPFLSEYASAGINKLQVTIIVNDSRMMNYPARLQLFVEDINNGVIMQTREYASIPPIYLNGGTTEILQGLNLTQYLQAYNNTFSGIDQNQYVQTGRIPDGQYRIGVRLVDSRRSEVVLSNMVWTPPGWFLLNNPPLLNLPRNKSTERVNDIQNVKLEWFPRHLGSMNSAFSTKYKIELFSIRIPGMEPEQIALSTLPVFTDECLTPRYILSQDKYLLEPGVEYAWRVQAVGAEGLTLFQNNGYSEVYSFNYGELCPMPKNNKAYVLGPENVELSWEIDPAQTLFETRFRVTDQEDAVWHTNETYINNQNLNDLLQPEREYEYQVRAKCNTVYSDFTAPDFFITPSPELTKFECGVDDDDWVVENYTPMPALQVGDIIYSGEYPVKLTKVTGSNGTFSGEGRLRIPFLNNVQINVKFENISVNDLRQAYQGEFISIYNPESKFLLDDPNKYLMAGDQVGQVWTGKDSAAIYLDYPVSSTSELRNVIWSDDNTIKISGPDGQTTSATVDTKTGGTTLKDSEGNIYAVDEEGNVTKVGESMGTSESYASNAAAYNQLSDDVSIIFENDKDAIWAFDEYDEVYAASDQIISQYEDIDGYKVPWKLVPVGKSGKITAKVASGSIDKSKVVFRTPAGTEYKHSISGDEFQITVIAAKHGDAQELFALYPESDSSFKSLGKVKIASYDMQLREAVMVPVQLTDQQITINENIQKEVNDIYLPFGIEWKIDIAEPYTDNIWEVEQDGQLDVSGSGIFSELSPEMEALNNAYSQTPEFNNEKVYLFVLKTIKGEQGYLLGDMPIKQQFGYLKESTDIALFAKTVAHELAHGRLQLKHTFSDRYGIDENSTNNLMDYNDGIHLVKRQWDEMFDQQTLLFAFTQSEEDGVYIYQFLGVKYEKLFTNIYEGHNNKNSQYYDQVKKNIDAKKVVNLDLDLKEEKSREDKDLDWLNEWKIRTYDYNDIFEDILLKIKNTDKGKIIPTMIAQPNKVYLVNHKIEDVEFNVAIYGQSATHEISGIKKIACSKFEEFNSSENKQHFFVDINISTDYSIIAFFNENNKEPQLIIQVSPLTFSSLDIWLKYLEILLPYREPIDGKSLEEIMEQYATLYPNEIKTVREMIENLEDENKGDYYVQLQEKVPYHNQRDNSHSNIADVMCNLTSEAMALEYLGISCPNEEKQFEDYLEDLRVEKKFGTRLYQGPRQKLAEELGVCHSQFNKDWTKGELISKEEFQTVLAPKLKEGCSMIIGGFMTDPGHIVRLQSITKDGIYVDDPYGKLTFNKDCTKSLYKPENSQTSENEKCPGNNQFWNWCQVKALKFFVVDIYYICEE